MSALGTFARIASPRLRALLLGAGLIFGLCAYTGATAHPLKHARGPSGGKRTARLFLFSSPHADTILAGSTAGYRITIRRRPVSGKVELRVAGGLPPGADAGFSPRVTAGSRSTLTVRTSLLTADGVYRIRIRARSGRLERTVAVTLTVGGGSRSGGTTAIALPDYQLAADAVDPLWPAVPRALDLRITNPNSAPLRLTSLTAQIVNIVAPRATPILPCSPADFMVQQYSGPYPVVVPASSTVSLHDLGVPSSAWPQVAIVDLPVDQDGCQGATVTLAYSGQATLG
ncbi:MAG TPA: hypothetical protein VKR21_11565 [Solirubrobacteraceae bacterium]|nr:hypothetical protein [Solirubrobacteraceae bacterium]